MITTYEHRLSTNCIIVLRLSYKKVMFDQFQLGVHFYLFWASVLFLRWYLRQSLSYIHIDSFWSFVENGIAKLVL